MKREMQEQLAGAMKVQKIAIGSQPKVVPVAEIQNRLQPNTVEAALGSFVTGPLGTVARFVIIILEI